MTIYNPFLCEIGSKLSISITLDLFYYKSLYMKYECQGMHI